MSETKGKAALGLAKQVEGTIQTIANANANAEMVLARTDAKAVTYENLKARLDATDATAESNKAEINGKLNPVLAVNGVLKGNGLGAFSAATISDIPYIKTLVAADNLNATTALTQGNYLIGSTTATPSGVPSDWDNTKIGFLSVFKITNYTMEILTQDGSIRHCYMRFHTNGAVPKDWKRIDNEPFHKRTLSASDNINTLLYEGDYLVNSTLTPGTYPTGMSLYGLLLINGTGNMWSQTLSEMKSSSLRTRTWTRNYYNAWSAWVEITNPETPEPVNPSQPLFGKKIVFMGDSITEGSGGLNNYTQFVSTRTGATCINLGIGGTQMANHIAAPDYNPFSFCNLATAFATNTWTTQDAIATTIEKTETLAIMKTTDLSTVDFIYIAYGQNDRSNGVSIGTIDSTNNDEFYGALINGINILWTAFPNLQFILSTPYHRPKTYLAEELTIEPFADAIINVASNKFYIPVLDLFRTAGINDYTKNNYLADGLHPSTKGYEYLGNKIGGWLLSVI